MAKKLLIIRHSKSSWETNLPDHDRPLAPIGIEKMVTMSDYIKKSVPLPEHWFCSTAARAQQTLYELSLINDIPESDITYLEPLYTFDFRILHRIITEFSDVYNYLGVVGHNPAITDFYNGFTDQNTTNVPTAGMMWLESDVDHWKDFVTAKVLDYKTPNMLTDGY